MENFQLGDKVHITSYYYSVRYKGKKLWIKKDIDTDGVFIGMRTIYEGYVYSEEASFSPTDSIYTALVAYNVKINPVYIPLDNIRKITQSRET